MAGKIDWRRRRRGRPNKKKTERHGHTTATTRTPEYSAWAAMIDRCYRKTNKRYRHYGGRGIRVHRAWRTSFLAFLADVGARPLGPTRFTLERVDNDRGYEPGNVMWSTFTAQNRNRRRPKVSPTVEKEIVRRRHAGESFVSIGAALGICGWHANVVYRRAA